MDEDREDFEEATPIINSAPTAAARYHHDDEDDDDDEPHRDGDDDAEDEEEAEDSGPHLGGGPTPQRPTTTKPRPAVVTRPEEPERAAGLDPQGGSATPSERQEHGSLEDAPPPEPEKIIKKPVSAFLHYCAARRNDMKVALPHKSAGEITKLISEEWRALGNEEKQKFVELAIADKDRFEKELGTGTTGSGGVPGHSDKKKAVKDLEPWETVIPVARVKKISKLDPEVKSLSKEATAVLAKATELFVARLAQDIHVASAGKKLIKASDVANCVHRRPAFSWLRADYPLCEYAPKPQPPKAAKLVRPTGNATMHHFFAPAPKRPKQQQQQQPTALAASTLSPAASDDINGVVAPTTTTNMTPLEEEDQEQHHPMVTEHHQPLPHMPHGGGVVPPSSGGPPPAPQQPGVVAPAILASASGLGLAGEADEEDVEEEDVVEEGEDDDDEEEALHDDDDDDEAA